MIDTNFLDQLGRFSLIIHKRVTSSFSGPRKSISTGRGISFKEHRIYAPGDDFRSVDWKVFARTDNLYIKSYEEERNLNVHIVMDASNSMNFGPKLTKFDFAAMIGVGFAYLAMKGNEKFQFSTFSDSLEVFQPKRGMSQLASMVHYLNNFKTKGASKLKDSLFQYKKLIGSRSLIILTSDFLFNIDEVKESLNLLGNNEIKVIQVLDPMEKEMMLSGDFNLKDSESGEMMRTYISERLRNEYRGMLESHTAKIQEACDAMGFNFFQITSDTPIFDAFYKIIS